MGLMVAMLTHIVWKIACGYLGGRNIYYCAVVRNVIRARCSVVREASVAVRKHRILGADWEDLLSN